MEWLSKIHEIVKLPTKYFGIVAVVTGAILFSPAWIQDRLYLSTIPPSFGVLIGALFLFCTSMVLVNGVSWFFNHRKSKAREAERFQALFERLENLDPAEQSVLREFVFFGQSSIRLPVDNPVVAGLVASGVITRVSELGRSSLSGPVFAFRLSKDAFSLISDDDLGIPDGAVEMLPSGKKKFTENGTHWLVTNRPPFTDEVARLDRPRPRWH